MANIITQIITGAQTLWSDIESAIENDAAKVTAALPSSAVPNFSTTVSAVKQAASDALGAVETGVTGAEPDLVTGVEAALDAWLAAATNGMTVVLNPLINTGITGAATLVTNAAAAWLLRTQASIAPPLPAKAAPATTEAPVVQG